MTHHHQRILPCRLGALGLIATGLVSVAHAQLPRTVAVQGHLAGVSGLPATDGTYAFTWRLYASASAEAAAIWVGVDATVVVTDGMFSEALGDEPGGQPLPLAALSGALWVGITVDAEPELPRRPMHVAPQALYAESAGTAAQALYAESAGTAVAAQGLACTACLNSQHLADGAVGAAELSAAARALFLSSSGGTVSGAVTVSGGLDLQGSLLSGARFASGNVAGQTCAAGDLGRIVVDAGSARLYWCDGQRYLRLATCSGACKSAASVPCGTVITDDCGDVAAQCSGTGSGCPAGQLCGVGGCFADGSSALNPATTCKALHAAAPSFPSARYWLDPDGAGGVPPFEAPCDMVTEGGGWTVVEYAASLPFQNYFTNGDVFQYLPTPFQTVLSGAQLAALQAVSTEGRQTYVGLCDNVVHYFYNADGNHSYAFGFKFHDGTETVSGQSSYAPHDIQVTQDGCRVNGGENGSLANATVFAIRSPKVPVINVRPRDAGDATEKFGSPLTDNPARLR